jgi:hypothetical protein
MRDINLSSRDLYGNIMFGFKSISSNISNFDLLCQKIQTLILSDNKQTYFSIINGGNVSSIGKFNFTSNGYSDFKAVFLSDLLNIKQKIKEDELINKIPNDDKLKSLELKDIIFDQKTGAVYLSIYISSNTSNKIFKLPIK